MRNRLIVAVLSTIVVTTFVTMVFARHHYGAGSEERPVVRAVVRSRVLSEQRDVIVSLPDSYLREPARRYPVLYVLDGSSQTTHTAESARLLARIGVMPECIIVGIPSRDENRARDYTPPFMRAGEKDGAPGRADRFLTFLETELIPYVERAHRTTSLRMLAGNSRGGLFVVYSLLAKPAVFQARFAYSPALWRDEDRIVGELARSIHRRNAPPAFLYLSLGDGENAKMTRAFRKTVEVLRTSAPPGLRWRAEYTRGAVHGDNAVLSTPVALHEYFRSRSPALPR